MDLGERLRLRDLLLGDDRRDELEALLTDEPADPEVARLVGDVAPLIARLHETVDKHLPLGTPREAVDYAIARATGFSVATVAEYCSADESRGGHEIDEIRGLLAEEVQAGRLTVEYIFECPSCRNVIDGRGDLPTGPFRVYCEHPSCHAERTLAPARAHAVFMNTNQDSTLESWI